MIKNFGRLFAVVFITSTALALISIPALAQETTQEQPGTTPMPPLPKPEATQSPEPQPEPGSGSLVIKEAVWKGEDSKLEVKGKGDAGKIVTIYNDETGRQLGGVSIDREGKWRFRQKNIKNFS